jgi:hypothetical protein
VAPDRLISVHDPEMRHGRKSSSHRFNAHKAQVAVDTDSQLITAVEVLPGNPPDADQSLEVVEASEAATGCEVEEVIGDCAYGAGDTRMCGTSSCSAIGRSPWPRISLRATLAPITATASRRRASTRASSHPSQ